jgi:uncharacterized protein YndB with AHSA1/START domain
VTVNASIERAFELFTARIGEWWPLRSHAVFGIGTVAFEGNLLVERARGGESVWAEVTEWSPPAALSLAWHPGGTPAEATNVRVTFETLGEQTLVTLIHTGWENTQDPITEAADYDQGWPPVLADFARLANGTDR